MTTKAELNLMTKTIRGKTYGVGRCTVHIGPAPLDGVAVTAGDEKWITTEAGAWEWLALRGLSQHEAQNLVLLGLRAWDESHSIGIA